MIRGKRFLFAFFSLALVISFLGDQKSAYAKKKGTENPQANSKALDNYFKGRKAYLLFTPNGFKEAIEYYNKAIEIDPKFAPAYAGLGEVYSSIGYYKYEVREDYEDYFNRAYTNIVKAISLDGNSRECKRALALNYLHLRRLKDAEAVAREVIAKYPDDAESYYILWAATGQNPESPYIKKALELNPNLVLAHVGLATAYFFKKGDYKKATEHYRKALELAASPQLHNYLGTALRTQGYLHQAVSEYKKAIELDPNFAPAYMNLGITLFFLNKFEDSISYQKKALLLNPNYPDAYYYLGRAYEKTNNPKEAIRHYETFIELAGKYDRYAGYVASAKESIVRLGGSKR
jgi:tetratricopeptide (TPR) repeat protein